MGAVTEWFPKSITPVYVGAYEVRRQANGRIVKWYSWWTGARWSKTAQTPAGAESCKHKASAIAVANGGFEWRGLAEEA